MLKIEAAVSPSTRDVLVRLRAARNKKEGERVFDDLIALASTRRFGRDLERLLTARERVDVYANRLWWASFKLHLVEYCVVPGGLSTAERMARALAKARMTKTRMWLIDAVVRAGEFAWPATFGARRLTEAPAVRAQVLDAIETASFGDTIDPRYARWAMRALDTFKRQPHFDEVRERLRKGLPDQRLRSRA